MTPPKQTVYLPVKIEDEIPDLSKDSVFALEGSYKFIAEITENGNRIRDEHDYPTYATHWLKEQEGYFFTPEQLNEYTANVIKQALETAAENAEITNKAKFSGDYNPVVDEESITNTFEETYKKFEV